MRKQEYFDMGIAAWLTPAQIERVLCSILDISQEILFTLGEISSKYIYEVQQAFFNFELGVPEEYTTQKTNFYGRDFYVDERVLIPRVETEILVSEALWVLNVWKDIRNTIYIDIGTGSSCIASSIILEIYPLVFAKSFALDISGEALEVAKKNTQKLQVNIELKESNLLEAVFHAEDLKNKNLCVTANLPYIKDGDFENMGTSTVKYEPDSALYGWATTGFEMYETLIKQVFQMKQIHKLWTVDMFIEIGFDQADISQSFLEEMWLKFEYFEDMATIKRVVHIFAF